MTDYDKIMNKINEKEDENKNELYNLNKYIEKNKENNLYFKFHIEMMNKDDILEIDSLEELKMIDSSYLNIEGE